MQYLISFILASTLLASGPVLVHAPLLTPELRTNPTPNTVYFDPADKTYVLSYATIGATRFLPLHVPPMDLAPITSTITIAIPDTFIYRWQSAPHLHLVLPANDTTFLSTTLAPANLFLAPRQLSLPVVSRQQFVIPWRYLTTGYSRYDAQSTWLPGWITAYALHDSPTAFPTEALPALSKLSPANLWSNTLTYGPKYPPNTPKPTIASDYLVGLNTLTAREVLSAQSPFVGAIRQHLSRLAASTPNLKPLILSASTPPERELLTALTIAFPSHFVAR
jgi:hypothetical protein